MLNRGKVPTERSSPDQVWRTTVLTNDTVRVPETGIEIPIAEIYEGISFPENTAREALANGVSG